MDLVITGWNPRNEIDYILTNGINEVSDIQVAMHNTLEQVLLKVSANCSWKENLKPLEKLSQQTTDLIKQRE